ncbi:DASH complex subunit Dad2 [Blumeria graminis f. sp. tritici 96224]|uniref:DASH complex subunit DAD2 n=2 Tax=Blumeria graminis f. sp. tritici 96224 TaxID=1268274 RepID=A0A656KIP2_BLUGR|nr:DASH complex subunit Dad2 [Blumeria graminis f. sp. tritici 96224]
MPYSSRPLPSHLRHVSNTSNFTLSGQSPKLLARIERKKLELANLKQLRDLSASLAQQMQSLEEKLATLTDGTEAVATVLSNWQYVLQAINMASNAVNNPKNETEDNTLAPSELALPQTLVRIPTENARELQRSMGP